MESGNLEQSKIEKSHLKNPISGNRSPVCGQFFIETGFFDTLLLGILLEEFEVQSTAFFMPLLLFTLLRLAAELRIHIFVFQIRTSELRIRTSELRIRTSEFRLLTATFQR